MENLKKVQYVVYKFPSKINKNCGYFSVYDLFSKQKYFWRISVEKIGDTREEKQEKVSHSELDKIYLGLNIVGGVPDCVACTFSTKLKIMEKEKKLIESYSLHS